MELAVKLIILLLFHITVSLHQGACLGNFEIKYEENASTNFSSLTLSSRELNGFHFVTIANNLSNPLHGHYFTFMGFQNNSVLDFYLQVGNKKDVKPDNFFTRRQTKFLYHDVIQQIFIFPTSFFSLGAVGNFSNFFIKVGGGSQRPMWMENGSLVVPSEEFVQLGSSLYSLCYRPLQNLELFHPATFSGNLNSFETSFIVFSLTSVHVKCCFASF
jgi:hypothetical protein